MAVPSHAQSTEIPAPPQRTQVVLRNVAVHTAVPGASAIAKGWVVFDDGKVLAVGAEPMPAGTAKPDADVIDAAGHVVTPGLWASATTLGLIETLQVEATDDTREFGDFRAEIHAATATNPDSDLPPVARNAGILMAHTFPSGGVVAGHASAMRLDGWTALERTVRPAAGLIVRWPMMEPVQARWAKSSDEQRKDRDRRLAEIDRFFDAAEAYLRARAADPAIDRGPVPIGSRGARFCPKPPGAPPCPAGHRGVRHRPARAGSGRCWRPARYARVGRCAAGHRADGAG